MREGDTLARLGGDEFVAVLLDLADVAASVQVLARLLEAAAEPVQVGDLMLQVSASLGVTFYPQSEDVDADLLLSLIHICPRLRPRRYRHIHGRCRIRLRQLAG